MNITQMLTALELILEYEGDVEIVSYEIVGDKLIVMSKTHDPLKFMEHEFGLEDLVEIRRLQS